MFRIVQIADEKPEVEGQRKDDEKAKDNLFRIHGVTWGRT